MPNTTEKHLVKIELPLSLELNDIKDCLEEYFVVKETETTHGVRWVIVNPDED